MRNLALVLAIAGVAEAGHDSSPDRTRDEAGWRRVELAQGTPVSGISIIETNSDGKVARQTDYFANPFEAPAWRGEYAERMEPVGSR